MHKRKATHQCFSATSSSDKQYMYPCPDVHSGFRYWFFQRELPSLMTIKVVLLHKTMQLFLYKTKKSAWCEISSRKIDFTLDGFPCGTVQPGKEYQAKVWNLRIKRIHVIRLDIFSCLWGIVCALIRYKRHFGRPLIWASPSRCPCKCSCVPSHYFSRILRVWI